MKTRSRKPHSHRPETWFKAVCYGKLIGGSILGITISVSLSLSLSVYISCNSPKAPEAGSPHISNFLKSDNTLTLKDGDSIPQVSNVKVPLLHYSPGQTPVVELIDTSYGAAFYYPAVVKDGYAYFTLKAGNPQDANRVFKVRGLLLPKNITVPFEMPQNKPISGNELFATLLLNRA